MAIVVPDEGERYLLKLLLQDTVPSDLVFILGLYRNDYTPHRETELADFLEATYSGYLPVELERSVWTVVTTVDGQAQSVYGTEFLSFASDSGEQDIYGYYVRDADSNVCLWAERFAAPVEVSPILPVLLLPVMRLHSEYEPAPP